MKPIKYFPLIKHCHQIIFLFFLLNCYLVTGANPGKAVGAIVPPKTYESKFIHDDFVQFGKQHSRYKAILPPIVLSEKCCDWFNTAVVNPT